MDINQYEWVIVKRKPTFWRGTLQRGIVLIPLFAAASYGIVTFSLGQKFFKVEEMLVILECICLFCFVVINSLWHMISSAKSESLIHYKVSEQGIGREKRITPLSAFKNAQVEDTLKKIALPYQEWRKESANPAQFIELTLDANQGKIKLDFPGEYERQKCIRTLQEYLHPTPITGITNQ